MKHREHKVAPLVACTLPLQPREVSRGLDAKRGGKAHGRHPSSRVSAVASAVLNGVTLEVNLHALRKQTLTTSTTAAAQDVAALGRLRTRTEAKLLLARSFGWLVGPLAHRLVGEKSLEMGFAAVSISWQAARKSSPRRNGGVDTS